MLVVSFHGVCAPVCVCVCMLPCVRGHSRLCVCPVMCRPSSSGAQKSQTSQQDLRESNQSAQIHCTFRMVKVSAGSIHLFHPDRRG